MGLAEKPFSVKLSEDGAALSLRGITVFPSRPVVSLQACTDFLGVDCDGIMAMIDTGNLLYAFNISTPKARCREVRVLSEALMAYIQRRPCQVKSLREAVDVILPRPTTVKSFQTIRGSTLFRRLGCSQGHVKNLIDCGELRVAPFNAKRCESPFILRSSASAWLHRRALGEVVFRKGTNL
jgi:hypothetical protein